MRVYAYAGTQHGPAGFPPGVTIGQQRANPNNFRWGQRALLLAMDRWTRDGGAPPPSQYPSIEDGTAVAAENLGFPELPSVEFSDRVHYAYRADYGPEFLSEGRRDPRSRRPLARASRSGCPPWMRTATRSPACGCLR